jgi:SAM-dependent methyltransferase
LKIKGSLRRLTMEFRYVTRETWTLSDYGSYWNSVKNYDDNDVYSYNRRFYDSFKMCSIPDGSTMLDLDCRTGNGIVFYHKMGKVKQAVAYTPSTFFKEECEKKLKKNKINSEVLLLTKIPLALKEKQFDAVLFLETIEHISPNDRLPLLEELRRVLKEDGELILSTPNLLWEPVHWFAAIFDIHFSEGYHRFLSRRSIVHLLRTSGFRIVREETTVLIPAGPDRIVGFGEKLEKIFKDTLLPIFGLRRIFICKKTR